jgi:hypothetical protein
MSEVACADYAVARAGIMVRNGVLVRIVTDGAVIVLVPMRGNPIYLPDKPLNSVVTKTISDSPHIKHLPAR